jgi:glycosyltransferase involved in cell wall biosynthesis
LKKLFVFLFLISFSFLATVIGVRWDLIQRAPNTVSQSEDSLFPPAFSATPYPLHNSSFTVVVVGRNNGAWVEKTLDSIFSQNYDNFRVIYVDDASNDGSFELARDKIYDMKYLTSVTLLQNEEEKGVFASLRYAIQTCGEKEIIVFVKGTDWLAHEWVLQRLNQYYADADLWMTYGGCKIYPGFESNFGNKNFPLQTFYVDLFKRLDGSTSNFTSLLLEMAEKHVQSLSEVLYISNSQGRDEI